MFSRHPANEVLNLFHVSSRKQQSLISWRHSQYPLQTNSSHLLLLVYWWKVCICTAYKKWQSSFLESLSFKQRRKMALLTSDRKPCALLECAYFLSMLLHCIAWWFVPEQKTKSVLQLGRFLMKPKQFHTSVVFCVFVGLISLMFAVVFVLPS